MSTEIILNGNGAAPTISNSALSVQDLREQINLVQTHMKENLKEGEHYGVIPGCGDKPALLKSGAEKLSFIFQFAPAFTNDVIDMPRGHREYRVKCELTHRPTGRLVANAYGSCSTMEGKYRFRTSERKCPSCGAPAIIKGKEEYGGGFICFHKKGGCGAKFSETDEKIIGQTVGRVEHDNPADYYNTCLKMASKRALVAATLVGTAASDIFTQDIEEMDPELIGAKTPAPVASPSPAEQNVAKVFNVERQEAKKEAQAIIAGAKPYGGGSLVNHELAKIAKAERTMSGKPPSDKQIGFLSKLLDKHHIPNDDETMGEVVLALSGYPEVSSKNVSKAIDALANANTPPEQVQHLVQFEEVEPSQDFQDDDIPF